MLPFHKVVGDDFQAVNELIVSQLHSDVGLVENIGHYIVEGGGKRLRPLLVLLAAKSLGYAGTEHRQLATVIEFIHTATLLHDDVVDNSALRRGRATANAEWGAAPAVLVGDFLYSRAFQMLVAIGNMDIMRVMADTTNIISEGEVQQLVNAGDASTDEQRYLQVVDKKTAHLFAAGTQIGALLAGASVEASQAMHRYGMLLGRAFQLVDDVLDYDGDSEALGKNVGDDLAEGKPTLPLIYTMANGSSAQAELVRGAIEHKSTDNLEAVVEAVRACGGLSYSRDQAQRNADEAVALLQQFDDSPYRASMAQIAEFAVTRSY